MFEWKEIVLFSLDEWPNTDSNSQKVDNSPFKFLYHLTSQEWIESGEGWPGKQGRGYNFLQLQAEPAQAEGQGWSLESIRGAPGGEAQPLLPSVGSSRQGMPPPCFPRDSLIWSCSYSVQGPPSPRGPGVQCLAA